MPSNIGDKRIKHGPGASAPVVVFPGGGIFFWWQAGAVHYIKDHYDLSNARLIGASAGALTAALAGCGVDIPRATQLALTLSMKAGVWARPLGLAGVWGSVVEDWLQQLLPHNAHEMCDGRVELHVNRLKRGSSSSLSSSSLECESFQRMASVDFPLPLERGRIVRYSSREEVVEACMASVHIPFFMDGKPFRKLSQGNLAVDGSFLLPTEDMCPWLCDDVSHDHSDGGVSSSCKGLLLDHSKDVQLGRTGGAEFVKLTTPEGIKRMLRLGYGYVKRLHEQGVLDSSLGAIRIHDNDHTRIPSEADACTPSATLPLSLVDV